MEFHDVFVDVLWGFQEIENAILLRERRDFIGISLLHHLSSLTFEMLIEWGRDCVY